ncbi:hypothetical protein B0P06_001432 [Clostridium saccharoperbutylacetonicum]|uniref:DUF2935 domain-containing protein n=1 Tax=Clostridium saccharoperbutylacetonicum N1-4(HMT) TaxID=931276 RepID=M1LNT0_9CLOT|nr:DUF2935 domain-containing protein [Clostridium saccharoperbutylacetonicum]AGF54495.1 hypothetical protein Cspa_c07100 [Clostridium saccharoperbutylacetonicum N1-4(HMT)]NRT58985.1 hypothetical protein [Clostridium saccharoperbutylacetonicum]NSB28173.1 hypothetical protein [Clostridium saccharoperbutylacetonicum]NSB41661.1 hypothetical protein [Clostridium saccharoperbutylacetonicum]
MKFNSIKDKTLFEHQFWLQILGDHSRFILNALSPNEEAFIQKTNAFITLFDDLLAKSHDSPSQEDIEDLNREAYAAAMKIREFKLIILSKQITDKINISLPPTFVSHMLNELDEYLLILTTLIKDKPPTADPIHLHLLWLPDGSGHASTIASNLDMTQKELIKRSKEYSKEFDNLYLRTIDYNGYTRTKIFDFPALAKLNYDVSNIMGSFKNFLDALKDAIIEKQVLGTLAPLAADHMHREECYYLTKLSMVSEVKDPNCDPTKPRIES